MKKLTIIWIAIFAVFFLVSVTDVSAQTCNPVCIAPSTCVSLDPAVPTVGTCQDKTGNITIQTPRDAGGKLVGYSDLGKFINNIITLAFILAIIVVLFMLIWGAFEWITSGGEKEAVAGARNRIISALIGLAILAVAFALTNVAGQFLGFNILETIKIPRP